MISLSEMFSYVYLGS